jgi:hypothetical protein
VQHTSRIQSTGSSWAVRPSVYAAAAGVVLASVALAFPAHRLMPQTGLSLLFLTGVLIVAARTGQACRYLVKDFGTSKSPKSTRQRGSHNAPAALRPPGSARCASHGSHNDSTALGCVYRTSLRAAAKTPGAYRRLSASSFALPWRTAADQPRHHEHRRAPVGIIEIAHLEPRNTPASVTRKSLSRVLP